MALPQYIEDLAFMHVNPDYVPVDAEHPDVKAALERRGVNGKIAPKRGEALFEGTDYPREWAGFVGQAQAKEELQIKVASAKARGARLEHTLFASGSHGIGKSTLATLLTHKAGAGLLQTSGPLNIAKAAKLIRSMENKDVLFIDEVHTMWKGEWLLPFMTEGRLYTDTGAVACPDITIVGATTDAGKLPATMLSRFMTKPKLVPYTNAEAALLVQNLALRMNVVVTETEAPKIARAASGNPRDMRSILTSIRDLQFALPDTEVDLTKAFSWAGFTHDGLTQLAQDMMLVLSQQSNLTASMETLHSLLGEPGPLKHPEQMLLQRGFTTITPRGRQLTSAGVARVRELARGN